MAAPKGQEFEHYQVDLSPPWLQTAEGAAFQRAFGRLKDRLIARAKEAVKSAYPEHAPADALPYIGGDVMLERGPTESEESYRARLGAAFDAWRYAGTKKGLLEYALAPAGFTNADTITNREWAKLGGVPPDGNTARWARFWVVLAIPHGITLNGLWGDSGKKWGEKGTRWGSSASDATIATIRRLITTWSPANARCLGVFLVAGDSTEIDAVPAEPWAEGSATFGGERCIFWSFV